MQSNPCEAIERPKTVASQPRGMSADDIRKLLSVIPATPTGLRDRALILTFTFTGRRRAEVMNLKAKDIVREGSQVFYTYRGKGGKTGKRELPMPAYEAIVTALATWGKSGPTSLYGPQRDLGARLPAARSTATCAATCGRRGCRWLASTSSATRRRSCGAAWASLSRIYASKTAEGLSPRSARYIHATLHRALGQATRWGTIPRNPAAVVDPPRNPKRELHPPSADDVVRMIDTAWQRGDRLAPLWTVAAYSGCRRGELLGLQWPDIDVDRGALSVRRTLLSTSDTVPAYGEPKTARSRRTIALPPEAIESLSIHKAHQARERLAVGAHYADHQLVFCTGIGTPLIARNVQRDFKLALSRANLSKEIQFHDLRLFAATLMLVAGGHIKVASERLGHGTIGITADLYTHVIRELDADAADRLGSAMRTARAARPVVVPVAAPGLEQEAERIVADKLLTLDER